MYYYIKSFIDEAIASIAGVCSTNRCARVGLRIGSFWARKIMFFVTAITSLRPQMCLPIIKMNFIGEKNAQVHYADGGTHNAGVLFNSNLGRATCFDSDSKSPMASKYVHNKMRRQG